MTDLVTEHELGKRGAQSLVLFSQHQPAPPLLPTGRSHGCWHEAWCQGDLPAPERWPLTYPALDSASNPDPDLVAPTGQGLELIVDAEIVDRDEVAMIAPPANFLQKEEVGVDNSLRFLTQVPKTSEVNFPALVRSEIRDVLAPWSLSLAPLSVTRNFSKNNNNTENNLSHCLLGVHNHPRTVPNASHVLPRLILTTA